MGDQSDGDKRARLEDKNLLQYDCLHSNMSHGQTKKVRSVCGLVVESVTERLRVLCLLVITELCYFPKKTIYIK